jgi:putative flippase GtrA
VTNFISQLLGKRQQFLAFLMTSGISVVVNLVLRYLLSMIVPFEAAVAIAYLFSTTVAFLLARVMVFRRDGAWKSQLGRFILVNILGFLQVLLVSTTLLRLIFPAVGFDWQAPVIAHFTGLASLMLTSYEAHRRFSFRPQADGAQISR